MVGENRMCLAQGRATERWGTERARAATTSNEFDEFDSHRTTAAGPPTAVFGYRSSSPGGQAPFGTDRRFLVAVSVLSIVEVGCNLFEQKEKTVAAFARPETPR